MFLNIWHCEKHKNFIRSVLRLVVSCIFPNAVSEHCSIAIDSGESSRSTTKATFSYTLYQSPVLSPRGLKPIRALAHEDHDHHHRPDPDTFAALVQDQDARFLHLRLRFWTCQKFWEEANVINTRHAHIRRHDYPGALGHAMPLVVKDYHGSLQPFVNQCRWIRR